MEAKLLWISSEKNNVDLFVSPLDGNIRGIRIKGIMDDTEHVELLDYFNNNLIRCLVELEDLPEGDISVDDHVIKVKQVNYYTQEDINILAKAAL